jgi:putative sterol carrier protein
MADATAALFESLRSRGHEPLLEQAHGTLRFELGNGRTDRWTVTVDGGDVTVSHGRGRADCTVRADKKLFDRIASGDANAMAATLRGAVSIEGDPELFQRFQRLFPSAPR